MYNLWLNVDSKQFRNAMSSCVSFLAPFRLGKIVGIKQHHRKSNEEIRWFPNSVRLSQQRRAQGLERTLELPISQALDVAVSFPKSPCALSRICCKCHSLRKTALQQHQLFSSLTVLQSVGLFFLAVAKRIVGICFLRETASCLSSVRASQIAAAIMYNSMVTITIVTFVPNRISRGGAAWQHHQIAQFRGSY